MGIYLLEYIYIFLNIYIYILYINLYHIYIYLLYIYISIYVYIYIYYKYIYIPGTQMTLVLIEVRPCLGGGLTFKNRGHWAPRYIYPPGKDHTSD